MGELNDTEMRGDLCPATLPPTFRPPMANTVLSRVPGKGCWAGEAWMGQKLLISASSWDLASPGQPAATVLPLPVPFPIRSSFSAFLGGKGHILLPTVLSEVEQCCAPVSELAPWVEILTPVPISLFRSLPLFTGLSSGSRTPHLLARGRDQGSSVLRIWPAVVPDNKRPLEGSLL